MKIEEAERIWKEIKDDLSLLSKLRKEIEQVDDKRIYLKSKVEFTPPENYFFFQGKNQVGLEKKMNNIYRVAKLLYFGKAASQLLSLSLFSNKLIPLSIKKIPGHAVKEIKVIYDETDKLDGYVEQNKEISRVIKSCKYSEKKPLPLGFILMVLINVINVFKPETLSITGSKYASEEVGRLVGVAEKIRGEDRYQLKHRNYRVLEGSEEGLVLFVRVFREGAKRNCYITLKKKVIEE